MISKNKKKSKYPDLLDPAAGLRKARRLFRRNRLHEAEQLILKLKHHGYGSDETEFLLARVYDKISILTSDIEYEMKAGESYDEIIDYSQKKRLVKKAQRLKEKMLKRISLLNDPEHRAHHKADQFIKQEPQSPKAWFMLGANFSAYKDPHFVINAFENAVSLHKNYIQALFRIGYIYQFNLNNPGTAMKYYLRLIKIPPYEDPMEPESANVRTILDACNELTELYVSMNKYEKVLSVYDHVLKIYRTYNDICTPYDIKKTLAATWSAAMKLDRYRALLNYSRKNHHIEFESLLNELGII
jgi:tetratricopeptide (TPR) repeat protein